MSRGVLLALAAKWRSEGEYWSGTPDDAARQQCADDLLTVLGVDPRTFCMGGDEEDALLARFGLPHHPSAAERGYFAEREAESSGPHHHGPECAGEDHSSFEPPSGDGG